jgi:hypothetical protein
MTVCSRWIFELLSADLDGRFFTCAVEITRQVRKLDPDVM